MKFRLLNTTLFLLLSLFALSINVQGSSVLNAKELLLKAQAFSKNTNYKAVIENQILMNKQKGEKIIYHLKESDGTSLYKCISICNGKEIAYELENKDGSYVVLTKPNSNEKVIVKNQDFYKSYTTIGTLYMPFEVLDRDLNRENSFEVAEIQYRNIPCYEITMKGKLPDDATLAKQNNWTLEQVKGYKEKFIENYPVTKTFIVGAKSPYIYKCSYYGSKGKKTFTVDYGIPDFNVDIDLKIFKTPSGSTKVLDANTDLGKFIKDLDKS